MALGDPIRSVNGIKPVRIHSLSLPLRFDPGALRRELAQVDPGEWVSHFNQSDFEGNWSGVALRSIDGTIADLRIRSDNYSDTPLLKRCPFFQELLQQFHFPITSARLLRLQAGSIIKEHCDPALGFEDGEIRLHIPIETSEEVYFYLEGRRVMLRQGETWYLDLSRRHRIENRSLADRVHLVIDGIVNDWLTSLFETAIAEGGGLLPPPSITAFDRFRAIVLADPTLQRALLATADRKAFVACAVELGRECGCVFHGDLVESAIRQGLQAWNERWVNA